MIPPRFGIKLIENPTYEKQFHIIEGLMQNADEIINCGDAGQEGELIQRWVMQKAGARCPVKRLWISSLTEEAIREGFAKLKDQSDFQSLYEAGLSRAMGDWLLGMNATRLYTIKYGQNKQVLSIGRVQTPTLALIVNRQLEIANFQPKQYWELKTNYRDTTFSALIRKSDEEIAAEEEKSGGKKKIDNPGIDPIANREEGEALVERIKDLPFIVTNVGKKDGKEYAPRLFDLTSLQVECNKKFAYSADETLKLIQSLYEKKLTTYPRTDCRYLPAEQFQDVARIITSLSGVSGLEAVTAKADTSLCGPVWDTTKVTAHHAIIPTGEAPDGLKPEEHYLYLMIATAYCLQFYPPMSYEAQKIAVSINDTVWEARGRLILEPGWTGVAAEEDEDAKKKEEQSLPPVSSDTPVTCADVETLKKKTTPPSRFSEGSLIEAMASVHRFISDATAKSVLKENEGLGTEATRAGIIETLKRRKFITPSGKSLVSTPLGQSLIDMTPDVLKDPVTTAQWEQFFEKIAHGELTLEAFMQDQIAILPSLLDPVLSRPVVLHPNAFPCPKCGKAMHKRPDKKFGGFFWACSDPDCRSFLPDDNGKPGTPREFPCPACGKPLYRKEKEGKPYWACYNREDHVNGENIFLPDNAGKPGQPKPRTPRIVTEFICPDCGKPLLIRQGANAKGPWTMFSCSGFPQCKASFWDKDGKPNFNNRVKR